MNLKNRFILIAVVLLALMLACTMPGQENSGDNDTISGDRLSTSIAQTVISANLQSTANAQQSSGGDTDSGGDSGGDQQGGQQPPADTPQPSDTPQPTNTLQPTATNTPQPTPTSPAGDPAVSLGAADWTHAFNSEYPWYTYTSSTDETEIKNGKYYFTFFQSFNWPIWSFAAEEIEDYYVEITIKFQANCAGKDSGGLIFGSPVGENDHGYVYQVSCDGHYRLSSYNGGTDVMISWHSDPAILTGPDQTNRIGVMVNGDHISLYVNGAKVDETDDTLYTSKGRFGVAASSPETADLVVIFDNAAYWLLP
jgi:hypothetical protein